MSLTILLITWYTCFLLAFVAAWENPTFEVQRETMSPNVTTGCKNLQA